jgi:uncharacterized protein
MQMRFHVLGIDDAPFDKRQSQPVRVVGVLMEGNDLVEGVAVTEWGAGQEPSSDVGC